MKREYRVGFHVYHGWRYWKTDDLETGEVLGWNTLYLPYKITKITPARIHVQHKETSLQLNRAVMERDGKQYHTRFHEYFYAVKPALGAADWNWMGNQQDFVVPNFKGACLTMLGLSAPYTVKDVKRAYKRLALKTHPDLGGSNAAFIKLKEAHDSALRFAK